ncbi:universal stress protein [Kitasatospora aureofaciens]|uniref:universal stress protein n=1 Tax=Kitasatospora aureofaciens TaxID=1894 RepID=UPI0033F89480
MPVRSRAVQGPVASTERGHPALWAVPWASEPDLAVVGSRGKGGFHGLAVGSVSHALLQDASCPVAVIRSKSHGKA